MSDESGEAQDKEVLKLMVSMREQNKMNGHQNVCMRSPKSSDEDNNVISEGDSREGGGGRKRRASYCSSSDYFPYKAQDETKSYNSSSLSSSPVEKDASSLGDEGEDDSKLPSQKGGSEKRDRSKLRKGKWTVEEEDYTSRIIHYFNTGLLTLPEGATLRSYLADKLNCDPMRITKKYAGASCLGRRVYHFHNRPQPTVSQIQLAKAELDILEQRFRQRVEEGRSGVPPPNTNFLMNLNLPAQANPFTNTAATLQSLLVNPSSTSGPNPALSTPHPLFGLAQALQATQPNFLNPSNPLLEALGLQQSQSSFDSVVLTVALARAAACLSAPTPLPPPSQQLSALNLLLIQNQLVHNGLVSSPTLTPIPPSQPQPCVPSASVPSPVPVGAPAPAVKIACSNANSNSYAGQLQRTFEEHLKANNIPSSLTSSQQAEETPPGNHGLGAALPNNRMEGHAAALTVKKPPDECTSHLVCVEERKRQAKRQNLTWVPQQAVKNPRDSPTVAQKPDHSIAGVAKNPEKSFFAAAKKPMIKKPKGGMVSPKPVDENRFDPTQKAAAPVTGDVAKSRTEEDKAAGTILIGFLSSLRDSYEEALRVRSLGKSWEEYRGDDLDDGWGSSCNFPNVTESSSSLQHESSVEESDWNSDKKSDPSSSEDSDKDEKEAPKVSAYQDAAPYAKGPPRKRHKRIAMERSHMRS